MRANNVILTFTEATLLKVVAEGYKVYDANNQLKETIDDTIISPDDYAAFFKERENNTIYSIASSNDTHCIISIDSEYETYLVEADYSQSIVEWDRFLKKE